MMNRYEENKKRELAILTLSLMLPLIVMSLILINEDFRPKQDGEATQTEVFANSYEFQADIKAKSAIVTELNSGNILFSKNSEEELPIASITKLITTLVAIEKFKQDNVSNILINEDHLTPEGDSGLFVGQIWGVKDLIDFTLITSSNDAAKALSISAFGDEESKFVADMNQLSRKIGLANTFFVNETGLDINLESEAGAISTANDVSKILKYIYENNMNEFITSSNNKKLLRNIDAIYELENTNKSVNKIPGVILSKTGYTDLAGGNLAIITDVGINNPVAIVVLGSSLEERENDILELYNETMKYYSNNLK